jgi:hypothetical protein
VIEIQPDVNFGNNTFGITSANGIFQTGPFAGTLVTADVNQDEQIGLTDRHCSRPAMDAGPEHGSFTVRFGAGTHGDCRTGLTEAIFILQRAWDCDKARQHGPLHSHPGEGSSLVLSDTAKSRGAI